MVALKSRLKFEPRDAWIGAYLDTATPRLFVCAIPFLPLVIEIEPTEPWQKYVLESWREGGDTLIIATWREGGRAHRAACQFHGNKTTIRRTIHAANQYVKLTAISAMDRLEDIPF